MKRALVIEDQKPVRESVGELLEVAGCEVRLIGDGQAALEELMGSPYDLITLDLNMPSMDGVSLAETITSQDGPNADTPIIVISAYLSPTVTENLQQLNIKHFLEKPFVAEELLGSD
jgi:CheY-like chemotaxis protein